MEGQEIGGFGFASNCCENKNAGAFLLGEVNVSKSFKNEDQNWMSIYMCVSIPIKKKYYTYKYLYIINT